MESDFVVYKNGKRIGHVYHCVDRFVAQLDKSISIRSQSFLRQEDAIKALENFSPEQLEFSPEIQALDALLRKLTI